MRGSINMLAARLSGAQALGDAAFESVSTDSRSVGPGQLFVALRGERFDAHDFLPQVAAAGAAGAVVDRDSLARAGLAGLGLPLLVVPDTLKALGEMGNAWRSGFPIPVIGVTGSNGKTTVKEMIAAILAAAFGEEGRLATRGNLNNEIGVPLTLFRLAPAHRAAVVELGMNHPGEIARLTAIAAPTIALVNNAQREHQEFMHTVEAVARENGCVIAGLPADGVAVYPGDDEYTPIWAELAGDRPSITFGLDGMAQVSCLYHPAEFGNQLDITLRLAGQAERKLSLLLQAAGQHNVRNALAAVACALAAGIPDAAIVRGLEGFAPVNGRLQKKRALGGATVIDDTYNANPDSVRAAIDVLAQAPEPRILVLGDMGEVGEQGPQFHQEIGAYAASRAITAVLVTGELTRHMVNPGASQVTHYPELADLLSALDQRLGSHPGATVLVKGSRFMKMERVVKHLTEAAGATPATQKEAH